jgi:adenylate cyclase
MTTQEVKRKLTAILSADVKGYSRLMEEDEKGTVHTLNAYKKMMANLIQRYKGSVPNPSPSFYPDAAPLVLGDSCYADNRLAKKYGEINEKTDRKIAWRGDRVMKKEKQGEHGGGKFFFLHKHHGKRS